MPVSRAPHAAHEVRSAGAARAVAPHALEPPATATPHPARPLRGRRVALVHHWMVSRRGGERTLATLAELVPGATLYTLVHDARACPAPAAVRRVVTSRLQSLPFAPRTFRALLPRFASLYGRFDLSEHDAVVSSDACLAKSVRPPPGAVHLCYCYSPVRYAWDLESTYLARSLPAPLRPLARAALAGVRRDDWLAAQRVDVFAAISATVAERIERCYGRRCAAVVPPPVDTAFFCPDRAPRPERALRDPPYLVLGAAVAYKRFEDAVDACRVLDRPLIVAGGGPRWRALRRRAGPRTRFVRDPDDETVRDLYRSCRALLFPGEEDFGLVPVEANACGRAVIAWRRGGVTETVEHGRTGLLYDEPGPQALAAAMLAFEAGEHDVDERACVERAAHYARPRFEERMAALLAAL